MSDIVDFARRIQEVFGADREPHWTPEEVEQYKANVGIRRQRFEHLASHLLDTIIRPRLEIFGSHFPIADLFESQAVHQCTCCIGYTERYPAALKIIFAIEHDVTHDRIAVRYDVPLIPLYVLNAKQYDTLVLALDEVDGATVAEWVEDRLLELLVAYLGIKNGERAVSDGRLSTRQSDKKPAA